MWTFRFLRRSLSTLLALKGLEIILLNLSCRIFRTVYRSFTIFFNSFQYCVLSWLLSFNISFFVNLHLLLRIETISSILFEFLYSFIKLLSQCPHVLRENSSFLKWDFLVFINSIRSNKWSTSIHKFCSFIKCAWKRFHWKIA